VASADIAPRLQLDDIRRNGNRVRSVMRLLRILTDLQRLLTPRGEAITLIVLVTLGTVLGALLSRGIWSALSNDLHLYFLTATNIWHGVVPYVDFPLEYPPLSILAFILPYFLFEPYDLAFLLTSALWVGGTGVALLKALAGGANGPAASDPARTRAVLAGFVVFAALCSPVVPWRYDSFPAFLTAVAFACSVRGKPVGAGCCLGLGIAAKLYPVVLGPVFVLHYAAERKWKGLFGFSLAAAVAATLPFAAIALVKADRALAFFDYHGARDVQLESSYAGIAALLGALDLTTIEVSWGWGSANLLFPGDRSVLLLQPALTLLSLLVVYGVAWHKLRSATAAPTREIALGTNSRVVELFATLLAAALLALIVTNKVFSPQYVAWLLPFVPFLPTRKAILAAVVFALTLMVFPAAYHPLVKQALPAILLLNLRNVLALGLLVWVLL
jgi:hypothetical protein